MISHLTIQNYQAHKKLTIELDPQITTIVGATDTGKSSILRSLRWICLNKPRGEADIRDGEDQATITIEAEGSTVLRMRGKGKNLYRLSSQDFVAFREDVPPAISALLNVNEINFQRQHDNPFWFGETAGEVSRQLNKIIDLSIIDSVLSYLDKKVRDGTTRVKICEERTSKAKVDRAALEKYVDIDEELQKVESIGQAAETHRQAIAELSLLISDCNKHRRRFVGASGAVVGGGSTLERGNRWHTLADEAVSLETQVESLRKLTLAAKRQVPSIKGLEMLYQKQTEFQKQKKDLEELVSGITALSQKVHHTKTILKMHEVTFEREMGDTCQLCGSQIL